LRSSLFRFDYVRRCLIDFRHYALLRCHCHAAADADIDTIYFAAAALMIFSLMMIFSSFDAAI